MRAGLSTACFIGLCETEEAFGIVRDIRAECCEAYLRTFYEYRPEFLKQFKENLGGVAVSSVAVNPANFECNLFSHSRRIRGDGLYWLEQVARSSRLAGAGGYVLKGTAQNTDYGRLSAHICGVNALCARNGLKLSLQNTADGLYNRPGFFKDLHADWLSCAFDLRSAVRSCYPYSMYLKDMSGAIAVVRICGFDENGGICLPKDGAFNYKELFSRIRDEGFDGDVIIDAPAENADEAKRSLEFVKELIYRG